MALGLRGSRRGGASTVGGTSNDKEEGEEAVTSGEIGRGKPRVRDA